MILLCVLKWLAATVLAVLCLALFVALIFGLIHGMEKAQNLADKIPEQITTTLGLVVGGSFLLAFGMSILGVLYFSTLAVYERLFDCDECTPGWLVPSCDIDKETQLQMYTQACDLACEADSDWNGLECWCLTPIDLEVEINIEDL